VVAGRPSPTFLGSGPTYQRLDVVTPGRPDVSEGPRTGTTSNGNYVAWTEGKVMLVTIIIIALAVIGLLALLGFWRARV
jgi:hypothetical protein